MAAEISPELKEKLRVIEVETDFFWDKPKKPKFPKLYTWFSVIAVVIFIAASWDEPEPGLLFMLVLLPAINFLQYFYSMQQYEMFTKACDLIRYYKNLCDQKAIES